MLVLSAREGSTMKRVFQGLILGSLLVLISGCATQQSVGDYNKGVSLNNSGNFQEAVVHLERARDADPDYSKIRTALGQAYAGAGKHSSAWREFREAVRLDPRSEEARVYLQRYWELYRKRGVLKKGVKMAKVRSSLGEPDSILDHYGGNRRSLWAYGFYNIEFRREKIYLLSEQVTR